MNNQYWKTETRKARHKNLQEDFTPEEIVNLLLDGQDELFTDFSKTFLDPCIGIGFIYIGVLQRRLNYCKTAEDVLNAIRTMYGTEIMEDNVDECKQNIYSFIRDFINKNNLVAEDNRLIQPKSQFCNDVQKILDHNIVCTDTFKWDYENWCPLKEEKALPLF